MDAREIKDKAAQLFSKGKFAKAAEQYEAYCKLDVKDVQTRLRMGDAWVKAGEKQKAVKAYTWAAEGFAKDGFLPRAIAASKLVLEVDPTHTAVQQMLADLYSRKSTAARPAQKDPVPMGPTGKRPIAIDLPADDAVPELKLDVPEPAAVVAPPPPLAPPPDLDFTLTIPAPEAPAAPVESVAVETEMETSTVQGVAIELDEGTHTGEEEVPIVSGESEVPDEGVDLNVAPAGAVVATVEAEPVQPEAPAQGYTLDDLVSQIQDIAATGPVAPELSAETGPKVYELELDEPAEATEPVIEPAAVVEVVEPLPAPVVSPPPAPVESERSLEEALVESVSAAVVAQPVMTKPPASAPPGLKPKTGSVPAVAKPAAAATSGFEASLKQLVKFDPPSIAPLVPLAKAASSFTELEFDGDSLLHSVELAAAKSVSVGAVAAPAVEEANEAVEETTSDSTGLPKIPLFSDLPHDAFIALFEQCPLRRFDVGQVIVEQGSKGESFFVICAGKVRVFKNIEGDKRKDLAVLEEGTFFGEVALLSDAPRTASVEAAAEDTQLLEIAASTLAELSKKHPTVAAALKKFCRQRLLSNLMATASIFNPFTKNERRELIQKFRAREVVPGDTVLKAGVPSDGLYLVLSGEVDILVDAKSVATLREGEVFGEMSLLTRSPATATVKAKRRTSLLRLPRDDFDQLIMSHPQILEMVAELTDSRKKQNAALSAKSNATEDMI